MRRRYQKGSLREVSGVWIAQWWENGHRRKRTLGRVAEMTKAQAQTELAEIVAPFNNRTRLASAQFENFVKEVYLPFYGRKWKNSTARSNKDRIKFHLLPDLAHRELSSFARDELQDLLDLKALSGLSYSVVDHIRWDLKQIFELAVAEDLIWKNPARLLFTPRKARKFEKRFLSWKEATLLISVLDLREQLISTLAIVSGMRPGEIFALKWCHIGEDSIEVSQRVYRGEIDTPKSGHSLRKVALSDGTRSLIDQWRLSSPNTGLDDWVFPSETGRTPLSRDNCWRRSFAPRLEKVGLKWANFQVMRRSHSSLMRELEVDPKLVADQLGHTLDVNLNVYTSTSIGRRKRALDLLESRLSESLMEH